MPDTQPDALLRAATVERKTRETEIFVAVDLDGNGDYDIETGIGFFDHMLEAFAKHAMIDLKIRTEGDLHIDMHHTSEDERDGINHDAGRKTTRNLKNYT